MIFFRKRHAKAKLSASPKPLNPDFNFWENRGAKSLPHAQPTAHALEQPAPKSAIASPTAPLPPDRTHTLLVKDKWVRPWGLRHFGYSFAAFIGVQIVVSFALFFIAAAQLSPDTLTNPTSATAALTSEVLRVAQLPLALFISAISMYAVWLGYMLYATRRRGARSWARDFALRFKWWDLPLGLASAGALFGLQALVLALVQLAAPNADYAGLDNGAIFSNLSGGWFFVVGLGVAGLLGPICEELYFRGFLLGGVQRWFQHYLPRVGSGWTTVFAILISSLVFGSLHFQGFETLGQWLVPVITGLIGIALALLRVFFKRLGPGIFAHISFNTTALLLAYFGAGS